MAGLEGPIKIIHAIERLAGKRPVGNFHAFGNIDLTPELRSLYEELIKFMPKFVSVARFNGVSDETVLNLADKLNNANPHMVQLRLMQARKAHGEDWSPEEEAGYIKGLQDLGVFPAVMVSGPKLDPRILVGQTPGVLHEELARMYCPDGDWNNFPGLFATGYLIATPAEGQVMVVDGYTSDYMRQHIFPTKNTRMYREYGTLVAPVEIKDSGITNPPIKVVSQEGKALVLTDLKNILDTADMTQDRLR